LLPGIDFQTSGAAVCCVAKVPSSGKTAAHKDQYSSAAPQAARLAQI
jgi:hypothetical protein